VARSRQGITFSKKTGGKKRTSIGKSRRTSPKNKSQKANWKRYRGQGK
jgi:hypothetical protein